jgi:hypothetical protein
LQNKSPIQKAKKKEKEKKVRSFYLQIKTKAAAVFVLHVLLHLTVLSYMWGCLNKKGYRRIFITLTFLQVTLKLFMEKLLRLLSLKKIDYVQKTFADLRA